MKRSTTLIAALAVLGVLAVAETARAGDFSFRIGGLSFGSGYRSHDRTYVIIDDDDYGRSYRRHHYRRRSYHRSHRNWPRVRDITPFRGHPPVYSVKPFPSHPRVIYSPQPYYPRRGGCRR
jgi:hypothetical protein